MLYEVLKSIRNFFPDVTKQKTAEFTIAEGIIAPAFVIPENQYFLIEGSALNDGVHKLSDRLEDEKFVGTITPLKIPKDFLALVSEIEDYQAKYSASPYTSESFGGYSYQKATIASGNMASWQDAFGTRLNAWRKL